MNKAFYTEKPGLGCWHMGHYAHTGVTRDLHTGASHNNGSMYRLSAGIADEHGTHVTSYTI